MSSSGWLAPKGGAGTPVVSVLPLLDGMVPPTMCYQAHLLIDILFLTLTFHYKLWGMTGLQVESLWWEMEEEFWLLSGFLVAIIFLFLTTRDMMFHKGLGVCAILQVESFS